MRRFLLVFILLFLLLPSAGAKVTVAPMSSGELSIISPSFEILPQFEYFEIYWHVSNLSNLLTNQTTSCVYHLYSKFEHGEHTVKLKADYINSDKRDFYVIVNGSNFTNIGEYCHLIECNTSGQVGLLERCFEVTTKGLPTADISIIFFSLIFFIIIAGFTYLIIYSLGRVVELNFDVRDLAINYGLFFIIAADNYLSDVYLSNIQVNNILTLLTQIGAWTNIVLPTLYFILTLTIGSWINRRVKGIDF